MKTFFVLIFFVFISGYRCTAQQDTLFVAQWNLENLFDNVDDPDKLDEEFLSNGNKQWTDDRIEKKMYNLARIIRSMNNYNGPDLLGVCEVEHKYLLDTMISKYLGDKNLMSAALESPDERGIDNAVIYNSDILYLIEIKGHIVELGDGDNTRLILQCTFKIQDLDTLYLFVNHWPSRRGGEKSSEIKRITTAITLKKQIDSIIKSNSSSKIIVLGDFNDEPNNISILESLGAAPILCDSVDTIKFAKDFETELFNLSYKSWSDGSGSFKYQDDFNMLDQIIVSKPLITGSRLTYDCNSFEVYKPEMMITRSGKFKGAPFPTFGGSRYLGGYSDHFPVCAKFNIER